MKRAVRASRRIGHYTARFCAALCVKRILLRSGAQRLAYFNCQSLFSALFHHIGGQYLQTGMAQCDIFHLIISFPHVSGRREADVFHC